MERGNETVHIATGKDFLKDLEAPFYAEKFLKELESSEDNKKLLNMKIFRPESFNSQEDTSVYLDDYLKEVSAKKGEEINIDSIIQNSIC